MVEITAPLRLRQRPSSWSSTPDLDEVAKNQRIFPKPIEEVIVNLQLPVRRRHTAANFDNVEESFTLKRPPPSPTNGNPKPIELEETVVINKSDSLAERVRKMQMMKRQGSLERDSSREGSIPKRFKNKIWERLVKIFFLISLSVTANNRKPPKDRNRKHQPSRPVDVGKPTRYRQFPMKSRRLLEVDQIFRQFPLHEHVLSFRRKRSRSRRWQLKSLRQS